jgi:hypothetical protein
LYLVTSALTKLSQSLMSVGGAAQPVTFSVDVRKQL